MVFYYYKCVFQCLVVEEAAKKVQKSRKTCILFYLEIYDRNFDKRIFFIWPSYHTKCPL